MGRSLRAQTSRAIPRMLKQSPRSGVSSISIMASSSSSHSASALPTGASSGSSMMPPPSSDNDNSEAEHSMPIETTPRSLAFFNLVPSGSLPPTLAKAVVSPNLAFGAPQTICRLSCSPQSTSHTRSLSASGCCSIPTIRATKTSAKSGAAETISSTSKPIKVS